jgi:transposase InsO family protein
VQVHASAKLVPSKAERFIQTLLREWALALTPWLGYYNQRRPHGALGHEPPESQFTAA